MLPMPQIPLASLTSFGASLIFKYERGQETFSAPLPAFAAQFRILCDKVRVVGVGSRRDGPGQGSDRH